MFSFGLILIPYSKQISDFPFPISHFPFPLACSLHHFLTFATFYLVFFDVAIFLVRLDALVFGSFEFCLLSLLSVNLQKLFNDRHCEWTKKKLGWEERVCEKKWFCWCVGVFVVGFAKMLHKIVEIMIVLLIELVLSVIGQFSKNVIHMWLSN